MTRRHLLLAALFYLIWLLWSGYFEPLLLSLGALSVVLVVWISLRMGLLDREAAPLHLTWRFLAYVPWLLREILLANIEVIRCILSRKNRIGPRLVVVEAEPRSPEGLVVLANSITLTPGTVTVDVAGRALLVHAIHDDAAEGLLDDRMNRRVARLEHADAGGAAG